MKSFTGLAAAPGIAVGDITIHRSNYQRPKHPGADAACDPEVEWQAFLAAQEMVDRELEELCGSSSSVVAEIFSAHRMMLHDESLQNSIHASIFDEGNSAALATDIVTEGLGDLFRSFDDEYFAGRAADIIDLGQRLLAHLGATVNRVTLEELSPNTILIAEDLRPSDLAVLSANLIAGIALAESTPTAHSAILARSLGIPLVCALGYDILKIQPNQPAVVDGNLGELQVGVSREGMEIVERRRSAYLKSQAKATVLAQQPAITLDGYHILVRGNTNSRADVERIANSGADGIGLLRTEYLFRDRSSAPTVQEQRETYVDLIGQANGHITVRALDAGGDKPVEYIPHRREENPFLGLRGVRLLIERSDLLKTQYRALQEASEQVYRERASQAIEVRYMLPMISDAGEILKVQSLLSDLRSGPYPLPLGIMIEVPSAALIAEALAPLVDFLSIGTNDLAQYVLASDRTNSTVARLADPLHPAVLRLIKMTCDAGNKCGRPVSLCGEVAGDVGAIPLLLGLGVTELSAPLPAVPIVKQTIRNLTMDDCLLLAHDALASATVDDVHRLLELRQISNS